VRSTILRSSVDILRRARAILSEAGSWCQDAEALANDDTEVCPLSSCAVQFCALGATSRAADRELSREDFNGTVLEMLDRAAADLFPDRCDGAALPRTVAEVNDHANTTHGDVLRVFDRAIELAENRS
jgi:hypothetical protein